jgi:hypothetical protein
MITRVALLFIAGALASLGAYACSSDAPSPVSATDAGAEAAIDEDPETDAIDAAVAACEVPEVATTGVAKCDECVQKNCCIAVVDCFGDVDCVALNDCFNACGQKHPTRDDAGAACAADCASAHTNVAKKFTGMLECESKRCGVACRG